MIFQETLAEWCESFARQVKGAVSRKGAAFEISLGEGWCIVEPIPDFSPTWAKLELVYPPGVTKDYRTGPTVERFDFRSSRGFDVWKTLCGKLRCYADDLAKANYRRGERDAQTEVLDASADRRGDGRALQHGLPMGDVARRGGQGSAGVAGGESHGGLEIEGRNGSRPGREDAGVAALDLRHGLHAADAAAAPDIAVPGPVPGSLEDEAVGFHIPDERKRRKLNGKAKCRQQRVQRELNERRVGMAHLAPKKEGRPPMAFFYVRWSDPRQGKGTSLEQQTGDMQRVFDHEYAKDFTKAPTPYIDAGVSSKFVPFVKRDMAKQLLADVQAGDLILAHRGDRLFRSLKDTIATMDLLHGMGVRLRLADSSMQTDWGTPSGKLIFSILGAVSEYDNELRAARVREGHRIRAEQGLSHNGHYCPPFCERVKYKKRKVVVLRESYVDLIEWCGDQLRSGVSTAKVSKEAARRAAIIEGKKPVVGQTYGFADDTLRGKGLKQHLIDWKRDSARQITVYSPFSSVPQRRFVWQPKKKDVEAEA